MAFLLSICKRIALWGLLKRSHIMSTQPGLILYQLASPIGKRRPTATLFATRQAAENERQFLYNAYGDRASGRVVPVRVVRQAEAARCE
jgi:hypothetical protein